MSAFWKDSIRRRFGPGIRSRGGDRSGGFGPRRVGLGRLPAVRTILSYGTLRDCVRGNYVLAKIG